MLHFSSVIIMQDEVHHNSALPSWESTKHTHTHTQTRTY